MWYKKRQTVKEIYKEDRADTRSEKIKKKLTSPLRNKESGLKVNKTRYIMFFTAKLNFKDQIKLKGYPKNQHNIKNFNKLFNVYFNN